MNRLHSTLSACTLSLIITGSASLFAQGDQGSGSAIPEKRSESTHCRKECMEAGSSSKILPSKKSGWSTYSHLKPFDMLFDHEGTLWAATLRGAYAWDLKCGLFYRVSPDSMPYWGVTLAPDGTLWFTSIFGGGAAHYDGNIWTRYNTGNGLPSNNVFDVAVTPAGEVWFTTDSGAARLDGKTWTRFTKEDGLATNNLAFAYLAPDGLLWLGSTDENKNAGISRFDGRQWTKYTLADGIPGTTTVPFGPSIDGRLWFGTIGDGGVSSFDGTSWVRFTKKEGLVADAVESFVVAPDSTLWFGSCGVGLSHYDGRRWEAFTRANGLPVDKVHVLTIAPDGSLWVGAAEDGIARYQVQD